MEALTCLAAISSVTTRVQLISSVVMLPQRNVLELLKTISTIDVLSGGRMVLGVGSGWNQPEMEALGYGFANRGQRMDEMLQVLRSATAERVPAFRGDQVAVPEGVVLSPPAAPGHRIPIYIGGHGTSAVSVRRTIAHGDGWMPYSPAGRYDADALRRTLTHLQEERRRRDMTPLDTIYKLGVRGHADPALEREAAELASLGFNEVLVQGIWDAGLDAGVEAIRRVRGVLAG